MHSLCRAASRPAHLYVTWKEGLRFSQVFLGRSRPRGDFGRCQAKEEVQMIPERAFIVRRAGQAFPPRPNANSRPSGQV